MFDQLHLKRRKEIRGNEKRKRVHCCHYFFCRLAKWPQGACLPLLWLCLSFFHTLPKPTSWTNQRRKFLIWERSWHTWTRNPTFFFFSTPRVVCHTRTFWKKNASWLICWTKSLWALKQQELRWFLSVRPQAVTLTSFPNRTSLRTNANLMTNSNFWHTNMVWPTWRVPSKSPGILFSAKIVNQSECPLTNSKLSRFCWPTVIGIILLEILIQGN